MAEKIGRELEVFTGYSAQHMNRAAHAVDANGLMPGGVREAKAALNAMLKALNKSVAVGAHPPCCAVYHRLRCTMRPSVPNRIRTYDECSPVLGHISTASI